VSPRLADLHLTMGPSAMEVDGGRGGGAGPGKAPGAQQQGPCAGPDAPASSSQVSNCSSTLTVPALEAMRRAWQLESPAWS
jgi:hypothetical protein